MFAWGVAILSFVIVVVFVVVLVVLSWIACCVHLQWPILSLRKVDLRPLANSFPGWPHVRYKIAACSRESSRQSGGVARETKLKQ